MKKVVKYCVVSSGGFEGLERSVNERVSAGWQPLGGICYEGGLGCMVAQAMVKYEEVAE